jgi:hypothetical protein
MLGNKDFIFVLNKVHDNVVLSLMSVPKKRKRNTILITPAKKIKQYDTVKATFQAIFHTPHLTSVDSMESGLCFRASISSAQFASSSEPKPPWSTGPRHQNY